VLAASSLPGYNLANTELSVGSCGPSHPLTVPLHMGAFFCPGGQLLADISLTANV